MTTANEANKNDLDTATSAASGCCGGPAPQDPGACCALDAQVKATGGPGCGCAARAATTASAATPTAEAATTAGKGCC